MQFIYDKFVIFQQTTISTMSDFHWTSIKTDKTTRLPKF